MTALATLDDAASQVDAFQALIDGAMAGRSAWARSDPEVVLFLLDDAQSCSCGRQRINGADGASLAGCWLVTSGEKVRLISGLITQDVEGDQRQPMRAAWATKLTVQRTTLALCGATT